MDFIVYMSLCLIYKVYAIEIEGKQYTIRKGVKAQLNVTTVINARSAIQCAVQCAKTDECTHANYRNSTCEFLDYESPGIVIEMLDEDGSKYLCKYDCYDDANVYGFINILSKMIKQLNKIYRKK